MPYSPSSSTPKDLATPQISPNAGHDEPVLDHSGANKVLVEQERKEAAFMTPMYDRLETNIPRMLMGFSDLDWPEDCQLFPRHEEVMEYIKRYSEDVRHLISFGTQVLDVRLDTNKRWLVKTQEVAHDGRGKIDEQTFDAVVVASGHFNVPYIPSVPGMEAWNKAYPCSISHSKCYRKPEQYAGKKVIVVGNSASGIDIGAQIQTSCKLPLIQSSKSESFLVDEPTKAKVNKPQITSFNSSARCVTFADGTVENEVDVILYCTGYFYSFPFLKDIKPPLITTGERVENLYQHMLYRSHPTLAFPVLNQKIIPFPLAEAQAAVIARVWSGRLELPSEDEMEAWEEQVIEDMGDGRDFHVLKFPRDADYIDMLHDWAMSADVNGVQAEKHTNGYVRRRSRPSLINGERPKLHIGKEPPYWGEREYWMRERFPAIKKAFQTFGDERHTKRTLEDVGFSFEAWKREQAEEGRQLL